MAIALTFVLSALAISALHWARLYAERSANMSAALDPPVTASTSSARFDAERGDPEKARSSASLTSATFELPP